MAERTNEKGLARGTSAAAAHTARARRALCPRGPVPPVVLPAQRTLRVTKEQIWEVGEGNPGPPSPPASTWGVGDAARSVPQLLPERRPHPWPLCPLRSWPLPHRLPWSVLCCSVSWGTWGVKATPAPSRSLEAPGGGVQGAQVPDVVSATGKGPVNAKSPARSPKIPAWVLTREEGPVKRWWARSHTARLPEKEGGLGCPHRPVFPKLL